ncbi:alpha/beta fold hydrolase [Prauserella flavalba]|uniref:AB hydrolase-1 domain-containing protein n=1 Tax=Prauserella flavalba TaxID=1477506 RepID=A0A318LVX4_9PSEU|nr:alpha/beta hydrolase [Prauserella flavalba]PXY36508.1 hypothetical protein BA062_14060 [Prauserella flavalba]
MPEPEIAHGTLHSDMPFLRLGSGRPLVFLPGITPHHRQPSGSEARFQLRQLRPLAEGRQVWWVNRRPGLAQHVTMAGLAADYAGAVHHLRFTGPVDVVGVSTGGSIALQLAADHPDTVRKLVVVSAAYRLGDAGREAQRQAAAWLRAGRPRRAAATVMRMLGTGPLSRGTLGACGWLAGKGVLGDGDPDVLATIGAEDQFDLESRLGDIAAPTLVAGGARDSFYGEELFTRTAALIPKAELTLYPGKGHLSTHVHEVAADVLAFLAPDGDGGP